jgi:putative Holliday junction resolvase
MRVLAVDWGEKRLGFAVSDENGRVAFPLGVVEYAGKRQGLGEVRRKLEETGASLVVVGLPLTLAGEEGESARKAREFFEALERSGPVPAALWDERMTTDIAQRVERECRGGRKKKRKRRPRVDGLAASVMLQSYLDFSAGGGPAGR